MQNGCEHHITNEYCSSPTWTEIKQDCFSEKAGPATSSHLIKCCLSLEQHEFQSTCALRSYRFSLFLRCLWSSEYIMPLITVDNKPLGRRPRSQVSAVECLNFLPPASRDIRRLFVQETRLCCCDLVSVMWSRHRHLDQHSVVILSPLLPVFFSSSSSFSPRLPQRPPRPLVHRRPVLLHPPYLASFSFCV